jgi:hypothetical protein
VQWDEQVMCSEVNFENYVKSTLIYGDANGVQNRPDPVNTPNPSQLPVKTEDNQYLHQVDI